LQQEPAAARRLLARVLASDGFPAGPLTWLRPVWDAVGELVGRRRSSPDPRPPVPRRLPYATPPNPFAPLDEYVYRHEVFEHLVPIAVCALIACAALVSSLPAVEQVTAAPQPTHSITAGGAAPVALYGEGDGLSATSAESLYLGDGSISNTMQNPGLGTDARSLLFSYVVQPGDTLTKIAERFGLVTATVYWANRSIIPNPASLSPGLKLLIPPIDGLMVTVGSKDTLASLATKYQVAVQDIVDTNNLPDEAVTTGQVLLIPGASGGPVPRSKTSTTTTRGGWPWPVGQPNYVSQYFWSGHHAIDIASPLGTPVYAAVSGTVVFSGWKSAGSAGYGGGYVIWVEVNSKLYVTYNHLSRIYVSVGQRVAAGQRIGSVGQSGNATGPHLHFEVWLGYPWALGTAADAVNPSLSLAGCLADASGPAPVARAGHRSLDVANPARGEPRPKAGYDDPRRLQQPDDPCPLTGIRRQQFEHARVVRASLARERPRDQVGQVRIPEGDDVGVAERGSDGLCRAPRPDPRDPPQVLLGFDRHHGHEPLDLGTAAAEAGDELRAAPLQPDPVKLEVRDSGQSFCRGRQHQPDPGRARCRLAEPAQQAGPRAVRLGRRDLLTGDGRDQVRQQLAGPRQADARESAREVAQEGMVRHESTGVVEQAGESGHGLKCRCGARTPRLGVDLGCVPVRA
jgi:murein DD-endopeptidase MepM/ murein hydrolase activator NlpD